MTNHETIIAKPELNVNFDICFTDNRVVPNHWHNHLEILYILEGAMHVKCNEKAYLLQEEGMFLFNSGDIHYTHSERNTRVILMQIPFEFLQRVMADFDKISFEQYFPKEYIAETKSLQQITSLLLAMKEVYEKNEDGYALLFASYLNRMLYELYKNHAIRENRQTDTNDKNLNRLKKIITYIEKHYAEPISLADIAKNFALNPEYFCRYFKKNMGFTFLEYINLVRLPHIYDDLLHTRDSISDIQEKHGFTNTKVFHRMFKEVYGCTPSEARKTSSIF